MPRLTAAQRRAIAEKPLGHTCPLCAAYIEPKDIGHLGGDEALCPHCKQTYTSGPAPGWSQLGN